MISLKVKNDLVVPALCIKTYIIVSVVKQCLQLVAGCESPREGGYVEVQVVDEVVILK
jgi:hypothetical protein